jgi:ApaG protein
MSSSEALTRDVRIQVRSTYVAEKSDPASDRWFFAYRIRITNEGSDTVQLKSRHWIITDANGRVEEVRGPGVVGKQPLLAPGQSFEYTSFCPLETAFGTMHGTFRMVAGDGSSFDAEIAPFSLAQPFAIN